MKKTLWKVIDESKKGKAFVTSKTQFKNLKNVLAMMDKENIVKVHEEWQLILNKWQKDGDLKKFLKENGGFINVACDDALYIDFGNWLVVQGEELFNAFQEKGHIAVIEYKKKHKIQRKDFLFECMSYVFLPYIS
ncbi:DUF4240 domain-containing protein [Bacillus thuringiensis]|uniref:DUF4240 domain-containing protein n=1 Tax=Bacillus thuringiensis TaxID=1428 RepID=UPI003CE82B3B